MSNTHNAVRLPPLSLQELLRRVALPFLLFAFVLTGLLILSWALLLPIFTSVEVGGVERSVSELRDYRSNLRADILSLERSRTGFVQPTDDSVHAELKERKYREVSFLEYHDAISRLARSFDTDGQRVVLINVLRFDAVNQAIELIGEVRNVGPRSMTILAQFTESLGTLSFAQDVSRPRFKREEDSTGAFYSPFAITLKL